MSPEERKYLRACSINGLIIDTNLMIVLLVGSHDTSLIGRCCSGFNEDTFVFMKRLLALTSPKIVITPQILAEVQNLTFHLIKEPGLTKYVTKLIEILQQAHEEHAEKKLLLGNIKMLAAFGFTDLSIIEAAKKMQCAVISSDETLVLQLLKQGCQARSMTGIMPFVPA